MIVCEHTLLYILEMIKIKIKAKLSEFSRILKDAFMAIPSVITRLMNMSLSEGIFPDSWKMAKMVPLLKGGEKSDVNNYRPVSLLPLPGKPLEKIVHSRIIAFFDTWYTQ